MNNTIVLYHGGCRDGFAAAWVVNKYIQQRHNTSLGLHDKLANFIPAYYGQEPPDCKGKDVIIVDFCYDVSTMERLLLESKSFIWLDHHKTADSVRIQFESGKYDDGPLCDKLDFIFRNDKSGAGLAWDYFFPNEPRPWLVDYVEDRDLWLHKLDRSEVVNAYIACLEFDFKVWDKVSTNIEPPFEYGSVAMMKTDQYVREVCKNVYFVDIRKRNITTTDSPPWPDFMFWKQIPIVNICQVDCSEVLHELCHRFPSAEFSLYWFKRQDGLYQYGLRSIGDFDVSTVAKLFGGGGHKNAAGFQLPYLLEELK